MAKQDDYVKTALRLPPALHALLTESATERGRSLNAEMVARLDTSFTSVPHVEASAILGKLEALAETFAKETAGRERERQIIEKRPYIVLDALNRAVQGFREAIDAAASQDTSSKTIDHLRKELDIAETSIAFFKKNFGYS